MTGECPLAENSEDTSVEGFVFITQYEKAIYISVERNLFGNFIKFCAFISLAM
jgi:hypothetical protein